MRASRPESPALVLAWLALAVCIGYVDVLGGAFQFDDYNVIINEARVHSWANWFAALGHGIRPLLKFSYTLNWTLDAAPFGFHLVNLLIHLANAYLVYRLAEALVQQPWQQHDLQQVPLFTALLFAVHPVHTEAVSYICGRSASLMTLFYLAALLSYVTGRSRHGKWYLHVATPLLFLLALAVKETAITFPLALLVWELGRGGRWQTALKAQWPVWALALVAAAFFLFSASYSAQMQRSAEWNSLQGNIATQLAAFAWLLRQWALPLWLNIDPDLPLRTDLGEAWLPLLLFISVCATMLACRRRRPWISFALAWAMVQLIPLYLFLPRLDVANERQLYLAAWPLLLALGIELRLWLGDRAWRPAGAALLLTLVTLTALRNQVYANEISLWEDAAQKSPHKARVHNNLGYAYLQAHRAEDARHEFITALQLDSNLVRARHNLYRTDDEKGKSRETLKP